MLNFNLWQSSLVMLASNLNTSHVKLQPWDGATSEQRRSYLNTSHVKLQQDALYGSESQYA